MADQKSPEPGDEQKQERARDLAEQALEQYSRGDQKGGDRLATEAVKVDRKAVEEVVQEIDEDLARNGAETR